MPENEILFDPGYSPLIIPLVENMEAYTSILASQRTLQQKKFRFKIIYPQIFKILSNNVAFYYGCLLWAFYLTNEYKNAPKKLIGNTFLSMNNTKNIIDQMSEYILNIKNSIAVLEKDYKYFVGSQAEIPKFWYEILDVYIEFLELNNAFIACSTTVDIKIPEVLANGVYSPKLNDQIQKIISEKSIETLLNIKIFPYFS